MRRSAGYLLSAFVLLTFLVCVGTLVLWPLSYWRVLGLVRGWSGGDEPFELVEGFAYAEFFHGRVCLGARHDAGLRKRVYDEPGFSVEFSPANANAHWSYFTFEKKWPPKVVEDDRTFNDRAVRATGVSLGLQEFDFRDSPRRWGFSYSLEMPCSYVVVGTAVPPLFAWRRRRRRRPAGHCEYCGYDLRASPRRCPECGRAGGGCSADAMDERSKTIASSPDCLETSG